MFQILIKNINEELLEKNPFEMMMQSGQSFKMTILPDDPMTILYGQA